MIRPKGKSKRAAESRPPARNGVLFEPSDIVIAEDERDSWCTPPSLWEPALSVWAAGITFDPCSNARSTVPAAFALTRADSIDGLPLAVWPPRSRAFVNFPFSDPAPWLEVIVWNTTKRPKDERCEAIVVCPGDFSVGWWAHVWRATSRVFLRGRPKFVPQPGVKASSSPVPIVMAYWGDVRVRFERAYKPLGVVVPRAIVPRVRVLELPPPSPESAVLPLVDL